MIKAERVFEGLVESLNKKLLKQGKKIEVYQDCLYLRDDEHDNSFLLYEGTFDDYILIIVALTELFAHLKLQGE